MPPILAMFIKCFSLAVSLPSLNYLFFYVFFSRLDFMRNYYDKRRFLLWINDVQWHNQNKGMTSPTIDSNNEQHRDTKKDSREWKKKKTKKWWKKCVKANNNSNQNQQKMNSKPDGQIVTFNRSNRSNRTVNVYYTVFSSLIMLYYLFF